MEPSAPRRGSTGATDLLARPSPAPGRGNGGPASPRVRSSFSGGAGGGVAAQIEGLQETIEVQALMMAAMQREQERIRQAQDQMADNMLFLNRAKGPPPPRSLSLARARREKSARTRRPSFAFAAAQRRVSDKAHAHRPLRAPAETAGRTWCT